MTGNSGTTAPPVHSTQAQVIYLLPVHVAYRRVLYVRTPKYVPVRKHVPLTSTGSRYKPTKHASPTGNMCESLLVYANIP